MLLPHPPRHSRSRCPAVRISSTAARVWGQCGRGVKDPVRRQRRSVRSLARTTARRSLTLPNSR